MVQYNIYFVIAIRTDCSLIMSNTVYTLVLFNISRLPSYPNLSCSSSLPYLPLPLLLFYLSRISTLLSHISISPFSPPLRSHISISPSHSSSPNSYLHQSSFSPSFTKKLPLFSSTNVLDHSFIFTQMRPYLHRKAWGDMTVMNFTGVRGRMNTLMTRVNAPFVLPGGYM